MISYCRFLIFDFRFMGLRPLSLKRPTPPEFRKSAIGNRQSKIPLRLSTIIILIIGTLTVHSEETPRSAMRKGLKAYKAGDFTNAVLYLEKTALEFPAVGNYDLGNAQYRMGDFEAAAESYNEALRTTDLELQAKAYFNRGNALLGRTTAMTGQEQIGMAIELAFQAMDFFEKAILLAPEDLEAKQNFERAQQLRLNLEYNLGKWYFDHAESLLQEYKAKDAQTHYQQAKKQFTHILENVEPNHAEAAQYLPQVDERLNMLAAAVTAAETDLATALQYINDYQYMLAAKRLNTESDDRKYAFDIKPDLKKRYEETIQKNQEVLKIIEELFKKTNTVK